VGYRDHVGDLGYNVSWNGSFNRNKVVSLYGTSNNPILDGGNDIGGGYGVMNGYSLSITEPGHPFAQFYGYKSLGIYKTAQQIASNPQFIGQTANLGDLIFQDVNHLGHLGDSDRTIIGNPNPKLVYGFNFQLNWKGFDLAAVFTGVLGVQIFNGLRPYEQYLFNDGNTTSRILKDSYLEGNGLTDQPRTGVFQSTGGTTSYVADPNGNYTRPSSYYVEPGGYLKLKNLQVGYTFTGKALHTAHVNNLRVFVMGNNLFTITRYSGLDPELSGSSTARGIDNPNQYPHTRIFSGGLTVGF
jgi:TonB-dependent starch-binding outer membrane protein SusC